MGAISVDWPRLLQSSATALARSSLFRDLSHATGAPRGPSEQLQTIIASSPESWRQQVTGILCDLAAKVLGQEVDAVDPQESMTLLGFDSLMALELREGVEKTYQVAIPVVHLFRGDSIEDITIFIIEELVKQHPEMAEKRDPLLSESPEALLENLDQLSDEEVEMLLQSM
jgi:polyketide synthase 12